MNTTLKLNKLKEDLEHQYKRFNNATNELEIDSIIYQMTALEIEMRVLLSDAKKIEKEPMQTPKKLKQFLSRTLYQMRGGV